MFFIFVPQWVWSTLYTKLAELYFSSKRTSLVLITLEKAQNTWASFPYSFFGIKIESPFVFEAPCVYLLPFQHSTHVHRKNNPNFEMQLSMERQRRKICTSSTFDLLELTSNCPFWKSVMWCSCRTAGSPFLRLFSKVYVQRRPPRSSPCSNQLLVEVQCLSMATAPERWWSQVGLEEIFLMLMC